MGLRCLTIRAIVCGLLAGAQPVFAELSGSTVQGEICMQKLFGEPVANKNLVNCTAGDIRLSDVIEVSPTTCIKGSTFTLRATFLTDVTASARYDAGYIFRTDGTGTARGTVNPVTKLVEGSCSLSGLFIGNDVPGVDLDGDTCGDLNSGEYEVTFEIPDVSCTPKPGTDLVRLPYCTSWHSKLGTVCNSVPPVTNAFEYAPDTKSKCVCDDDFSVPVIVEQATITVTKTVLPSELFEPGGTVSFEASIKNDSSFENVTIDSIKDFIDPDGADTEIDLTAIPACTSGEPDSSTPFCTDTGQTACSTLISVSIAPGATETCQFKGFIEGNAGDKVKDEIEGCVTQPGNNNAKICAYDDKIVIIKGRYQAPTASKTATGTANCSLDASYTVTVNNNDTIESQTLNAMADSKFGDITQTHAAGTVSDGFCDGLATCEAVLSTTCGIAKPTGAGVLPATIAASGQYSCMFTGKIVNSSCDFSHNNIVTATVVDGDKHCSDTDAPEVPNGAAACLTAADCEEGEFCVDNQSSPTGNATVTVDVDPPSE